jgi:hypothetical protein
MVFQMGIFKTLHHHLLTEIPSPLLPEKYFSHQSWEHHIKELTSVKEYLLLAGCDTRAWSLDNSFCHEHRSKRRTLLGATIKQQLVKT